MICFSGITDCYQPAERNYELTRGCLQVAAEAATADRHHHQEQARDPRPRRAGADGRARSLVHVSISITTLDEQLARRMEPRTSRPTARLEAIRELSRAGVPTRVMVAPVIPGLNDSEIPQILKAAREAGAGAAGHVLLRLSGSVRPVFLDWLARSEPTRAARVEGAIRQTRGGQLNDTQFGRRMRGTGTLRRANRSNVRDLRQARRPRRIALALRFLAVSTTAHSGRTTATVLAIARERRRPARRTRAKKVATGSRNHGRDRE